MLAHFYKEKSGSDLSQLIKVKKIYFFMGEDHLFGEVVRSLRAQSHEMLEESRSKTLLTGEGEQEILVYLDYDFWTR